MRDGRLKPPAGSSNGVQLTASNADVANPERGFYEPVENFAPVTPEGQRDIAGALKDAFAKGYRLVYGQVRLDRFRDQPISPGQLSAVDGSLQSARDAGVKVVLRFVYNNPSGETGYEHAPDASADHIIGHIAQLKPVLRGNQDTIAYLQAGFVGAWGEWHAGTHALGVRESDDKPWQASEASREKIRDALLDAWPGHVQFRYPEDVVRWAKAGVSKRIGVHNDCFLADPTDVGTYSDDKGVRAKQRDFVAKLDGPFGGETCKPDGKFAATMRTSCEAIREEGAKYHLSYLNRDYETTFHNTWAAQGCFSDVSKGMGYRFRFSGVDVPAQAKAGSALPVQLSVANDGWARSYAERPVMLHLQHVTTGEHRNVPMALNQGPTTWEPSRTTSSSGTATLPPDLTPGDWRVALGLPDNSPRLAGDVRYSIRPANADDRPNGQYWDAAKGVFFTGQTVRVD